MVLEVLADFNKVHNISTMAHINADETTVMERILSYTGISYKLGETHNGTLTTNWVEQEKEHGTMVTSVAVTLFWNGDQINVIDTPSHVNFVAEVERSLRTLDGAVAIFDDREGVEPQSETMWRQVDKYGVPHICFINKMDKMDTDFYFLVSTIKDRLHATPIVMQVPIGAENDFEGQVDLVTMESLHYPAKDEKGDPTFDSIIVRGPTPEEFQERTEEYRETTMEAVVEGSDELTEVYLENSGLTIEQIKEGIRLPAIPGRVFPVHCGTALRNMGVQLILDAVVDFLSSSLDIESIKGFKPNPNDEEYTGSRLPDEKKPPTVLVSKAAAHPLCGRLIFVRVYSSKVESGSQVLNLVKGKRERTGKILQVHSNKENPVDETHAGYIYVVIGLKDIATGDMLCAMDEPIVFESMAFPKPVIQVAVEPKSRADQERMGIAIQKLAEEDPTFMAELDSKTGQTVTGGMGELHLDIIVDRMHRKFKVEANVGALMVVYREITCKTVEKYECMHEKQTGGPDRLVRAIIALEPSPADSEEEYKFKDKVTGGRVSYEYIPSISTGIQGTVQSGIFVGYPTVGIKTTLLDDTYHEVDSFEMAFRIAGSMTLKETAKKANPVLLESITAIEVRTPEECMGDVIGDLNSRHGQISPMGERHSVRVVRAQVSLSEVFSCVGDLRSKTQGHVVYSMEFDSYTEVPRAVAEEIIGELRGN